MNITTGLDVSNACSIAYTVKLPLPSLPCPPDLASIETATEFTLQVA